MRRLILILVIILIAIGIFYRNLTGIDHNAYNAGQYLYTLDAEGNATIYGFTAAEKQTVLTIPSFLDGNEVTKIAEKAMDINSIMELYIADSISEIEPQAIYNCDSLVYLSIPADCTSDDGFTDLTNLKAINITKGQSSKMTNYASIEETGWFDSKDSIEKVIISEEVTSIGSYCFEQMSKLSNIEFSKTVESIGSNAFKDDLLLNEIILPISLKSIDSEAFGNITGATITISNSLNDIELSSFEKENSFILYNNELIKDLFETNNIEFTYYDFAFDNEQYIFNLGNQETIQVTSSKFSTIIYESSDESVLTIDGNGKIQTHKRGTATVTAKSNNATATTNVIIDDLSNNEQFVELVMNEEIEINVNLFEALMDERITEYSYSSDKSSICEIKDGIITAKKEGKATITISTNTDVKCYYIVNVVNKVESIEVPEEDIVLKKGGTTKADYTIYPKNATNKQVKITSSDPNIVKVSDTGEVIAMNNGSATLTISAMDGSNVQNEIGVVVSSTVIKIANAPVILMPEKNYRIRATSNDGTQLSYISLDESIAKVDEKGTVTALSVGSTEIIIYNSTKTSFKKISCVVYDAFSYGIDISEWNGWYNTQKNFNTLKSEGIDFVYIRAAYEDDYEDIMFEKSYNLSRNAGLEIGAYHYITATTKEKAISEANWMVSVLKGKKFEYPIMLDIETNKQKSLSVYQWNVVVDTYVDILEKAGYKVIVYSYASMLKRINQPHDLCVANWGVTAPYFNKKYTMWQFTSDGLLNGLSGRIDMDICFYDYPSEIKENHLNGY